MYVHYLWFNLQIWVWKKYPFEDAALNFMTLLLALSWILVVNNCNFLPLSGKLQIWSFICAPTYVTELTVNIGVSTKSVHIINYHEILSSMLAYIHIINHDKNIRCLNFCVVTISKSQWALKLNLNKSNVWTRRL